MRMQFMAQIQWGCKKKTKTCIRPLLMLLSSGHLRAAADSWTALSLLK